MRIALSPKALVAAGAAVIALGTAAFAFDATAAEVRVYKSPTCGCCGKWVDHLRAAGFNVVSEDVDDMNAVKTRYGVQPKHASCHTAVVDGYVLEGHVPADALKKLLKDRPKNVAALAVPGMPMGSPGMEGPRQDRYDVIAVDRAGAATVYMSK